MYTPLFVAALLLPTAVPRDIATCQGGRTLHSRDGAPLLLRVWSEIRGLLRVRTSEGERASIQVGPMSPVARMEEDSSNTMASAP